MKRKLLRGAVNGKTTIALALSAVMTMGMIPSVYAADVSTIKDMPNGWARKAVEKAVENNMLTGYEGYVRPDDNITRAEVAVVFNKILGTEEAADISSFADVKETDWFYSEMAKIVNAKIMSGDGNNLMPQSEITRQELFVLVARVLGLSDGNEEVLSSFSDNSEIADWAKGSISALVEAGYVSGNDGKLNPSANMTRAEFAQILSNMAEKYIVSGGEYNENVDGNIFVSADGVTISGKISGNVIIGDGVKNVTFKDAEIGGDVIVRGTSTSLEGTTVNGNLVINSINGTPEISVDENSSVGGVNAVSDYSSEKTFENTTGKGKNVYSPKSDDENAENTDNAKTKDTPKSTTGGGGGGYNPPVTYYTLRFETGGGSDIPSVRESYNTYIDLTKYVPTWRGHAFIGWYSERSLTNKVSGVYLTKDMTVYAGWRVDENPNTGANPFTDVSEKDWFYGDVMFVYENGLMLGTSKTLFSPHGTVMRGMMATILWRMEGSPVPKGKNSFTDVEAGKWYADAITWTAENGIFAGYGKDKFGPDDPITREQLAAIFYRYADYKGYDLTVKGDLDKFKDADKITDYAKTAMQWAVGSGLVKGKSGNLLDPQGTATRAEIAAMLHRFIEKCKLVQGKAPGGLMGWIDPKRLQIPKTGDSSV